MSNHAQQQVWDRDGFGVIEKLILLDLADAADRDGSGIWKSVTSIASDCGVAKRTVQRAFDKFRQDGLLVLEKEAKQHCPRIYKIDLDRLQDYPLTDAAEQRAARRAEREKAASRGDTRSHPSTSPGVTEDAPRGDRSTPRGDTKSHPNPYTEPVGTKTRAREADGAHDDGPSPANGHWKARQEALRTAIGDRDFKAWIEPMIPIDDNGVTIKLATIGPFAAKHVPQTFGSVLERELGRTVEIVFDPILAKAIDVRSRAPPG